MQTAIRYAAAVLVALTCASAAIDAQQNPAMAPDGPATPGWVFTPSIGVGGSWDSNVLLANVGDEPPSDYATPVDPSVSLDFHGKRLQLSSGYEGSFLMYRTLDALNSAQHVGRATVEYRATRRLRVFAEENFDRAPTTDSLQLGGVPFFRVGSKTNAAGGGFDAALARHTTMTGRYTLRSVSFDEDRRVSGLLQGGHSHEFAINLAQALSNRLTIGGGYELQRAVLTQGFDTFNIQTGSFTINYEVTPTVAVNGLVGVSHLGSGLTQQSRIGPTFSAGIAKRAKYLVLSASYERAYVPAYAFGGTFQNEALQGAVRVPFARNRGYVEGSATRSVNEPITVGQPNLRSLWFTGSVGYHVSRWLSAEGFVGRTQQSADRPGSDLGRNQVGFRLVAAKPLHLR
jgi:hypothetical protein